MKKSNKFGRLASRALANIVAVAAVTAIFGFKTFINEGARAAERVAHASADAAYDPYFTEQP